MTDPTPSDARFTQLLAALSQRTATPLEANDGLLILTDGGTLPLLVVELSGSGEHVTLVTHLLPIPAENPAGALAQRLLRVNADREALEGAVIAADGLRRQYVLIRELSLDLDPEAFADAVESLLDLAAAVKTDVAAERTAPPTPSALFLRGRGRP